MNKFIISDTLLTLRTLPAKLVQCVVTSPPYYGLRDYGIPPTDWPEVSYAPQPGLVPITIPAQTCCLGLEKSPEAFIGHLVLIFRETYRVLKDDGTLWVNIGDSYGAQQGPGFNTNARAGHNSHKRKAVAQTQIVCNTGVPAKNMILIPQRLALALQADGWYVRQEEIWHKPNPMPESVTDRPTKSHEYLFLLTKSESYFYDNKAIQEAAKYHGPNGAVKSPYGRGFARSGNKYRKPRPSSETINRGAQAGGIPWDGAPTRQRRSVWSVTTKPFKGAHFATFPPDLIEPCIKAGSRPGDTVLDPFFGAGTTGLVAQNLARDWVGIELNPTYCELARERIGLDACVVGPMA